VLSIFMVRAGELAADKRIEPQASAPAKASDIRNFMRAYGPGFVKVEGL